MVSVVEVAEIVLHRAHKPDPLADCITPTADQEITRREIGGRQGIAVPTTPQHELALVVRTPERVRLERVRQPGPALGTAAAPPSTVHQAMPIQYRMDGADRGELQDRDRLLPQFSRIFGAPHAGYSRFNRTMVASTGAGERLA